MKIQNSSTIKEIRTAGGLSLSEGFPTELGNTVIPVLDVNPKSFRRATILGSLLNRTATATNQSILTAQTEEVFITGFMITNNQDASSDNTLIVIQSIMDGVVKKLYSRQKPTTTALSFADMVQLSEPLKIDLGATVGLTLAFTVGSSVTDVLLYGYKVPVFENL